MNATIPIIGFLLSTLTIHASTASWYGQEVQGKLMANGKPFDPSRLTGASWFYPLGTKIKVTSGGRSVIVVVTDTGPARRLTKKGRILDLSRAAFLRLATLDQGLIEVKIERVR